jgi:hypothetical protein
MSQADGGGDRAISTLLNDRSFSRGSTASAMPNRADFFDVMFSWEAEE